ncbi:MAG: hypothetical protein HXX16_20160 [Bacteroidales bacterium]|nr:hypothetical protein [Bacteroidales bacterium]
MKTTFILTLAIALLGFSLSNRDKIIIGRINLDPTLTAYLDLLIIELKDSTLVVGRTNVNQDGTFCLRVNSNRPLDLFYYGLGINETYMQTLFPSNADSIIISLKIPKEYNKKGRKVVCPKCMKNDNTIPITYGLHATVIVQHISPKGDTTYTPYSKKEYYEGGCVTSEIDPKYFCKRDKIKF